MLVTIKSSNHVWTAPDGQMKIWEFTGTYPDTGEEMQGATRSNRIAQAINQTLDLTTTVSKTGKTYYVQVQKEGGGWNKPEASQSSYGAPQAPSGLQMPQTTSGATERFERAVERFERAVDNLIEGLQTPAATAKVTGGDVVLTELPPATDDMANQAIDILGGEIVDDY